MGLASSGLLPGETLILSKNANAVIEIDEHGLSRFAFDHLMGVIGMRGKEAIGGRLHLTNYRLIFKAHAFNRLRGTYGVFLPTVRQLRDTSSGVKRQCEVATETQKFTFVVWGVPGLISAIHSACSALGDEAKAQLGELALAHPERVGDGLKIAPVVEAFNRALTDVTHHPVAVAAMRQAIQQDLGDATRSVALNLVELFSSGAPSNGA